MQKFGGNVYDSILGMHQ